MTDSEQKRIFSKNLNYYLGNTPQIDVAKAIGVSPQLFNTWCKGIALPRMGKLQLLADYFGIEKSDLIDDKSNPSEEKIRITQISDAEKAFFTVYHSLSEDHKRTIQEYVVFLKAQEDSSDVPH